MNFERDEKNCLTFEKYCLSDLANEHGTPLYVYSERQILKNIHSLHEVMGKNFKKYRIQYALKANTNPHILNLISQNGLYADCSSPIEAQMAKRCGFDMSRSTYTGNFESQEDLETACKLLSIVNLDDYHRLEDLPVDNMPEVLSFRINPGIGRGGFEHIVTGGTDAKFGIAYENVREAYQKAIDLGVKRFGIHMMTGSNILEPFYFAEITQKLLRIIEEYLSDLDIEFEFINIGGGLGIPYHPEEESLDIEHTFKMVSDVFYEGLKKINMGDPEIVIEPGRYIMGNAGALITKVTHIKKSYRHYIGLDAGMNTLIRPSLYKAYHQILMEKERTSPPVGVFFCGQICENSDIHPVERYLPLPHKGDIAMITNAGAYGHVMSSNYNNRPRCAEILLEEKGIKLIREQEPENALFSQVPDFEF